MSTRCSGEMGRYDNLFPIGRALSTMAGACKVILLVHLRGLDRALGLKTRDVSEVHLVT